MLSCEREYRIPLLHLFPYHHHPRSNQQEKVMFFRTTPSSFKIFFSSMLSNYYYYYDSFLSPTFLFQDHFLALLALSLLSFSFSSAIAMASSMDQDQIEHDFPPFIRIYKDGRVERLLGTATVPPSDEDPLTGVGSKDVVISPGTNVSARLYLPKLVDPRRKLPVVVYYHGGGFCIETAFSPTYHIFLNKLVAEANVIAVSVDYRRVPEHPLPAAYDDSWVALQWVVSHATVGT